MKKGKRLLSVLLVVTMLFGPVLQCNATKSNEYEKKAEKLEEQGKEAEKAADALKEQKKEAEKAKQALVRELSVLLGDMEKLKTKIDKKEAEISEKEEELINARNNENDQYESMKKRIKYMYENGNAQMIEILMNSENFGDFLNKAEYISTISEYDRDMLKVFQKVTKEVKEQEEVLKEEYHDMEEMQNQLIADQDRLENLVSTKASEIAGLEGDLKANAEKIQKLQKAAKDARRKQQEALAAEEEKRRQEAAAGNGSAGAPVISGNGYFTHPCPGLSRISSEFGWRAQPLPGASTNHKGMDMAAPTGTPIYAAAAGTVTTAHYSGNAGNMISINHGNGIVTIYMHCHAMYVSPGQRVEKGQHIGAVGSTGNSTGPHLHFQVNVNGTPTNPRNYL